MRLRVLQLPSAGPITRGKSVIIIDRAGELDVADWQAPEGIQALVFADDVQIGEDWEQAYVPPLRYVLPSDAGQEGVADAQSALWEQVVGLPTVQAYAAQKARERLEPEQDPDDSAPEDL